MAGGPGIPWRNRPPRASALPPSPLQGRRSLRGRHPFQPHRRGRERPRRGRRASSRHRSGDLVNRRFRRREFSNIKNNASRRMVQVVGVRDAPLSRGDGGVAVAFQQLALGAGGRGRRRGVPVPSELRAGGRGRTGERFRFFEDKQRALVSRLLQRKCAETCLGLRWDEILIKRTKGKKPFVASGVSERPRGRPTSTTTSATRGTTSSARRSRCAWWASTSLRPASPERAVAPSTSIGF